MNASTFLFAPCVPHWVRAWALEVALPGVDVGVDVERDLERMGDGDGCEGMTEVLLWVTFGRVRDGIMGRGLPGGEREGVEGEKWMGVSGVRWVRGRRVRVLVGWLGDDG